MSVTRVDYTEQELVALFAVPELAKKNANSVKLAEALFPVLTAVQHSAEAP